MGSIVLRRGMKLSEEQIKRIRENAPKSDADIDLSDIPEITDEEWKKFKPARLRGDIFKRFAAGKVQA